MGRDLYGDKLTVGANKIRVDFKEDSYVQAEKVWAGKVWAGLFKNRELVVWYTPISMEGG